MNVDGIQYGFNARYDKMHIALNSLFITTGKELILKHRRLTTSTDKFQFHLNEIGRGSGRPLLSLKVRIQFQRVALGSGIFLHLH